LVAGTPLHTIQLRIELFQWKEAKYAIFEDIYSRKSSRCFKNIGRKQMSNPKRSKAANQITFLK